MCVLLRRVRWYVFVEGNEVDLHNAHWHGNVLLRDGHRVDQCATCSSACLLYVARTGRQWTK